MPLTSGTRLGTYEITAAIGADGMGEVYRARDARLDRDVAHIHGLEESGGVRALVMELVEGEDLAQKIAKSEVSSLKAEGGGLARDAAGDSGGVELGRRTEAAYAE